MLSDEQYKLYYEFITNNISKMKQTYKHLNDFISIETINYLIELLSTWEFDNKWMKNNISEKIKNVDEKDKEIIKEEFYDSLIAKIKFQSKDLSEYNMCGFYSLNTTISYKIDQDKTLQKMYGRTVTIDNNSENEKIILAFFLIYHMLVVEELIPDKGLYIKIEDLKGSINNNRDIINLCKLCIKDVIMKDSDLEGDINEFSKKENIPLWFIENCIEYKRRNI